MNQLGHVDVCVVGAGVIGLAIARQLSLAGKEVMVLERGPRIGEGVSSRNSEVIHAGIYYPLNSLKAQLCVRGKQLLYDYCEQHQVGHARIGKMIVAANDNEAEVLAGMIENAANNGVHDLRWLSRKAQIELEPQVNATHALLSPSTGIVSAHELMNALLADLESAAGAVALNCRVEEIIVDRSFNVVCSIADERFALAATSIVNAAGLGAQQVATHIDGFPAELVPTLHYCKGSYFVYQGSAPFRRLIYPVPEPGTAGLGVHATLDLGGQVKFGPDVEYVASEDYAVTAAQIATHAAAIKRYFPALEVSRLSPGYAGIRPKLQPPGGPPEDFVIQGAPDHGIPGLVNLFGIESPGLTSSMAIAETVSRLLEA